MIFIGIFFLELLLLFFSAFLLVPILAKKLYKITKNNTLTIHLIFYILLPGIIIHELSHALFASLLFVPIGQIKIYPEITEEGVKFGSLEIGRTDIIRRFIIGISPVITGVTLVLSLIYYLTKDAQIFPESIPALFLKIGLLYFLFTIINTMSSSKKDLEGAGELLVVVFVLVMAFYLYFGGISINQDYLNAAIEFIKSVIPYLLIPLLINFGFYFAIKIFLKNN